ncbi:hypothetical protein [Helicobacter trogontum]|uniref:hypothetical protein n=1 Tax=Helicobacter trogontum TaxID=50960 RepID=UPI001F1717A3|nr:hypothetical protein [Helicobacter trogontum]
MGLARKGKASLIDLDKCDGCKGYEMPQCVSACKEKIYLDSLNQYKTFYNISHAKFMKTILKIEMIYHA